jgi:hypothetical protein
MELNGELKARQHYTLEKIARVGVDVVSNEILFCF